VRKRVLTFFIWMILTAAACLLLYPSFMDALANVSQESAIGSYAESVSGLSGNDISEELAEAEAYNQTILQQQIAQPFSYRGSAAGNEDSTYMHTLNVSDGVMAYIDIPKINLNLPVVHGTNADDLTYAVGHMYGTSLPVGGPGTHAVIAAHTGLATATLFTNLTEMEKGDSFFIHVLNEVHRYVVDQIEVVLPEDEDPYLQVENGKDYVTLYTCTPYGINDHRLLVRGVRSDPDDQTEDASDSLIRSVTKNRKAAIKAAGIALIPIALLVIGIWRTIVCTWKKQERTDPESAKDTAGGKEKK